MTTITALIVCCTVALHCPQSLMKYWNNPEMLAKIGAKIGDVKAPGGGATAGAAGARPAAPPGAAAPAIDITNMMDAAR